jgi:hypothetical protein
VWSTERMPVNNVESFLFIGFLLIFAIAASWYVSLCSVCGKRIFWLMRVFHFQPSRGISRAPLDSALPPPQRQISPHRIGSSIRFRALPHVVIQNRAPVARFLVFNPNPPISRTPLDSALPPPQCQITCPKLASSIQFRALSHVVVQDRAEAL